MAKRRELIICFGKDRQICVFWYRPSFVGFAEYFRSEEVIFRDSTKNDVNLSRRIISYSAFQFRYLLKEHDFASGLDKEFYLESRGFLSEVNTGIAFFQDKKVIPEFEAFTKNLNCLVKLMERRTSQIKFGDLFQLNVRDNDSIRRGCWKDFQEKDANELNKLATQAWKELEKLVIILKSRIPETFDLPIKPVWLYTNENIDTEQNH